MYVHYLYSRYGGFQSHGSTPKSCNVIGNRIFREQNQSRYWGTPILAKPPYKICEINRQINNNKLLISPLINKITTMICNGHSTIYSRCDVFPIQTSIDTPSPIAMFEHRKGSHSLKKKTGTTHISLEKHKNMVSCRCSVKTNSLIPLIIIFGD